ncbi:hypothetical protein MBLNU459_g7148t1 [Dothideomycetes sp. NU459]
MPPRLASLPRAIRQPTRHYALYSTAAPASTLKCTSVPAPHAGSIRIVSLNRPAARNAISKQLLAELGREIEAIHAEGPNGPTRALVLASESDKAFCAGADLKERVGFSEQETRTFLSTLRQTFTRLSTLPIPTISAVHASAFGGGLELALCTSLRVFGSTATVGLPETRLGIIPGAGGTYRLPALIGTGRARDLVLTGRRVAAAEAYFLGLCDRLVEVPGAGLAVGDGRGNVLAGAEGEQGAEALARREVLLQAVALAREVCEGAPAAVRAALDAVNSWGAGEEVENLMYDSVLGTEDRVEALRAFGEKRKPVFSGR